MTSAMRVRAKLPHRTRRSLLNCGCAAIETAMQRYPFITSPSQLGLIAALVNIQPYNWRTEVCCWSWNYAIAQRFDCENFRSLCKGQLLSIWRLDWNPTPAGRYKIHIRAWQIQTLANSVGASVSSVKWIRWQIMSCPIGLDRYRLALSSTLYVSIANEQILKKKLICCEMERWWLTVVNR